ncbi:MAG: hypothetical protein AAGB51_11700 [Planctomycetota bacterium]
MNLVQKLRSLVDSIAANKVPVQVQRDWDTVGRLLQRTPVNQAHASDVLAAQDIAGLDALVRTLEAPTDEEKLTVDPEHFPKEDREAALRAFKKRLKLARLNDESRLGGRYTSGGKRSGIDAIQPPGEYPPEMWHALVAEGKLVDTGQGFFRLPA